MIDTIKPDAAEAGDDPRTSDILPGELTGFVQRARLFICVAETARLLNAFLQTDSLI
jgi:hypothetical protein